MPKTLKRHITSRGNELEFYKTDLLPPRSVIVRDDSCQMERLYTVGRVQSLSFDEPELIKSIAQVIRAWTTEKIHF
jgi:hypothetical protein